MILRASELATAVLDGYLRWKVLRVHCRDVFAFELLEKVFDGELPDVSHARQPLHERWLVERRVDVPYDFELIHVRFWVAGDLSCVRSSVTPVNYPTLLAYS